MAITTYAELQTAVANWLDRTDLTSRIVEFITLGEAKLNRELRTRTMETNGPLATSIGSRTVALPAGFLEPIALFIELTTGRVELAFVPSRIETDASDGQPDYWTIDGANIAFEREPDAVYNLTLKYLKKWDIATDLTNTLLSTYPDAYLSAALVEGFAYTMDEDRAMLWAGKLQGLIEEINRKEARSRSQAKLRNGELLSLTRPAPFNINTGV